MNIEEAGELKSFEPMLTDELLYISVIRYKKTGLWASGPSNPDKAALIRMIHGWTSADAVRIYSVRLPSKQAAAA